MADVKDVAKLLRRQASEENNAKKALKKEKTKPPFSDASDGLANTFGYLINFFHIPTSRSVSFKAWLTNFTDSYQSNWATEDTYGRMDPIATFQNTRRVINFTWDVVAGNLSEAITNMKNCEMLFSMLYPSYEAGDNAGNLLQAPLFKVKFANLITQPGRQGAGMGPGGVGSVARDSGLLGYFGGFDYTPDFEAGFFTPEPNVIYPQLVSLSAEFSVMHNFPVGWDETADFREASFPYGGTKGLAPGYRNDPTAEEIGANQSLPGGQLPGDISEPGPQQTPVPIRDILPPGAVVIDPATGLVIDPAELTEPSPTITDTTRRY